MTTNNPIDSEGLKAKAKASKDKEAYKLIERNPIFRVGVGSRTNSSDTPTFFVEVVINLGKGSDKVDVTHLEKTKLSLIALQSRNYSLIYEEGNSISCEVTKSSEELTKEYVEVTALLKKIFDSPD